MKPPADRFARLLAIAFWSVIAAAFIGPGTVTTAASAGAAHGYALLWALAFSTGACLVLQEAAARLTIVSGRNLGEALRERYPAGWRGAAVLAVVLGAILLGCAAYEAGNLLGGVAGGVLATGLDPRLVTVLSAAVAVVLLWGNRPSTVAHLLSVAVAVMGVAFLTTAAALGPSLAELLRGALVPRVPEGAALLALGLVGTTVVPYNLFLGSGLAARQRLGEMRFGLAVAVLLGGTISAAVLVTGAAVAGAFSFEGLADVLAGRLGPWARRLFALGLLAAGLSSAVTAPLAAAVTARSLFGGRDPEARWSASSWRYRAVWMAVVATGLGFALSGVRPVPAIIAAQAFNGVLLPLAATFLFLAVNDPRLLARRDLNGWLSNLATTVVLAVSLLLGGLQVGRAGAAGLGAAVAPGWLVLGAAVVAALVTVLVARAAWRQRRGDAAPPADLPRDRSMPPTPGSAAPPVGGAGPAPRRPGSTTPPEAHDRRGAGPSNEERTTP